ncbi:MAG: hypothetical protein JNL35_14560 [Sphingopyxis sp.]|nr:hypothetical protein [Sphingopyxis sp.]
MSLLLALVMAAAPEPVFDCAIGKKRLTVTQEGDAPESAYGGLIVLKNGEQVTSRRCNGEGGEMREWPIFKTLPVDADNLTPEF